MSLFYSNPHCGYGGQCFLFDSVQVRSHSDLSKLFILWRIFPPAIFAAFMPSLFGRFCHLILYIFRLFSLDFSPIIFSYSCNLLGEIILGSCQYYKVYKSKVMSLVKPSLIFWIISLCTTWPCSTDLCVCFPHNKLHNLSKALRLLKHFCNILTTILKRTKY